MTNTDDIRTTGPVGLKGLSAEQRRRIQQARQQAVSAYRNRYNPPIEDTSEVQRYSPEEGMASWGSSSYDNPIQPTYLTSGEMQDTRYENQPWYDTLANGIGKMLGTAGTTFVSSLVGLPAGIAAVGRGLAEGEENPWANLWDNDVTNGLAQVDDWLEKNMTNYKSQEQEQNKWWQNIGSMNWWADDVIKNMGFTLGAAASMAVGSGGLGLLSKGLGLVKNVSNAGKMANNFLSALFSATGEGMIEARQGVEERNKLELQRLDNALNPEYTALQNQEDLINQQYQATRDYQSYRQQMADLLAQRQELDNKREQGLQQIEESGRLMGNKILLANQGLLTLGNMIQFGKTMTKSFDKARHAAEVSSKAAKPSWVSAQRVSNNIKDGYQVAGKGVGRLAAATKGLLTEGSEEMNQQWIQNASGAYYNKEDVNDYWKAKLNHDAVKDTADGLHAFNQAISQGFRESWGDIDQWEQFVIGGLTGMAGSYAPTKLFNQDKTKKLFDPRRYGEWSGGAYNEIQDFNKEYNQYAENIDDVNKILASDDFFGRVRDFVGHTYTEGNKTVAAENNDKKQWKDEDDKQMIHDVQAFLRAGKLDDLRAIYHEMGDNLSDDDIDNIVKSTTKEITQEEDKQNYATAIDEQIAEHQRKITQLNQQAQDIAEAQEGIDPSERSDYQVSVTPTLENIFAQIDDENDAITNLQQQKESYTGQKYYEGAYVDRQGNRTKTNDEIREEIKHNAEELDRKVDSYLDSIDYVNQRTNGQLTKDQEDNLAYLHNVKQEKNVRFNKIMADVRKKLPSRFLIKTDKSPEELARINASSDLAFTKNEKTPKGYVEVDTSAINDTAFANFFTENVIWGQNIQPTYTKEEIEEELKASEEDAKYSKEEQEKRREQRAKELAARAEKRNKESEKDRKAQQDINVGLIRQAFVDNAMNKEGKSLAEALRSEDLSNIFNDINDALVLRNEVSQFEDTLEEYFANPSKVDTAKKKEEKKTEDKKAKEAVDNASMTEMLNMDDDMLASILRDGKKGKNKSGNKAKKALGMKNGRESLRKNLESQVQSGIISSETADDALKMFDEQLGRMSEEDDESQLDTMDKLVSKMMDTDTEAMNSPEILLNERELADIEEGRKEFDEAAYDERVSKAKDAINAASADVSKTLKQIEDSIDTDTLFSALEDKEETDKRDAEVSKIATSEREKATPPNNPVPKRNDEPTPLKPVSNPVKPKKEVKSPRFTSEGEDSTLSDDMQQGSRGAFIPEGSKMRTGKHPWRSVTSEISYYSNEEWSPSPSDPYGKEKKQRYDAVKKKLEETGAYTAMKSGIFKQGVKVGFKVFQDVNDEAGDFVIFITSEDGSIILGDLPSNDPRLETSSTDVSMDALYRKIQNEWAEATEEQKKAGMLSSYTSQIDKLLIGKVKYQTERQTVKELVAGSNSVSPLFAIRIGNGMIHSPNTGNVIPPLTGNVGQPYVLIATPYAWNSANGPEYYAVPIKTATIGELDNDTIFIQVLKTLLDRIKHGTISDAEAHHALESLIAVGSVHVNLDKGSNTKKALGIRVTTFNRESGVEKGVPYTIFEGNREDLDIEQVVKALSRFHVNVSATYINGYSGKSSSSEGSEKGQNIFLVDGRPIDYNEMIAEVALTNAASPVAVNNWIMIRPLEEVGSRLEMMKEEEKMPSWGQVQNRTYKLSPQIKGKESEEWTVAPLEGYKVYDSNGIVIEQDDKTHSKEEKAEALILAAQAFGMYNLKTMNTPYACMIGNKSYMYDPNKRAIKTYKELEKAPFYDYKNVKALQERARQNGGELSEADKYYAIDAFLAEQTEEYLQAKEEMENHKTPLNFEQTAEESQQKGSAQPVQPKKDHTKEVEHVLSLMREERDHFKLVRWDEENDRYIEDENGDYYMDDRDNSVHARVSNALEADQDVIRANEDAGYDNRNASETPYFIPSTASGNAVDTFVRRFYADAVGMFDGIDFNNQEDVETAKELASEIVDIIGVPNINKEDAINLAVHLARIKKSMGDGWEIDSSGIVASGYVSFDGKTSIPIAGTIDLLAYNKETGQYVIIDMKSHLGNLFDREGNIKEDPKTQAKLKHWIAQQHLYKKFLETKYGIKISGLRIMPFSVTYNTKFSETHYEVENGVLKDKGITVDIHPRYDGKLIKLPITYNPQYSIAQLPDTVKRLFPKNTDTIVVKPEPEKLPLKAKILDTINRLPEGRSLKEFVYKKYADNQDVMKLIEIVESNIGSETPILMTAASQSLLLSAINQSSITKAIQKEKAKKMNISLDIPENAPSDTANEVVIDDSLQEFIDGLPEDIAEKVINNQDYLRQAQKALLEGADPETFSPKITIRHKKATSLPYQKLDLQRELRWLHKNMPQVSRDRKLQIIKGLVKCSDGSDDFGRLERDIMLIGTQAARGTVYHEAFHAVVQFILTDEEIEKLHQAAIERYGKMPAVALEERLANDFEDYVKGIEYEDNRILRFFKELWKTIKALMGRKSYIETLYRNINTGVYVGREFRDDRNNAFVDISRDSRELAKDYEYLTNDERQRVKEAGIDREIYNQLTKEQKEYMLHCVV